MALTMRQILLRTPRSRRDAADYCKVKEIKAITKKSTGQVTFKAKTLSTHTPAGEKKQVWNTYVSTIEVKQRNTVIVDCSCLEGNTKVLTDKGWKSLMEIAQPRTGKLTINYVVNGCNVQGTAPFYTGQKPTWRLTFDNGVSIITTKDHRFLESVKGMKVRGDVKIERRWTEAKELTVGSKVVINSFDPGDIEHNRSFYRALFLGVLMGDGTVSNGSPYCHLYKDTSQLLGLLERSGLVKSLLKSDRGMRVSFTHEARELMAKTKFKNKVSVSISTHTQLMGYLSGLLITDGSVGKELVVHGGDYLKQVQGLLLQYGYASARLKLIRPAGTETNKGMSTKDLYMLKLSRQDGRKLNGRLVLRNRQQTGLDYQCSLKAQERDTYSKITKIEYAGRQHVYDLTVPEGSKFVANGFIVHNCDDFWAVWEYALNKQGAANIGHSNGQPPNEKNPSMRPGCCKHLVAMSRKLIERNKL